MKKIIAFTALALVSCSAIFAASYKNNTYQKLAKEYTIKAEKALDAGEYALAEEYAAWAQKRNAKSQPHTARCARRIHECRQINDAECAYEFRCLRSG